MLSKRLTGIGVMFIGDYNHDNGIKFIIENCDTVELETKMGSEIVKILVKEIAFISSGNYRGKVYGFRPEYLTSCNGISIGAEVNFNERNIFCCTS